MNHTTRTLALVALVSGALVTLADDPSALHLALLLCPPVLIDLALLLRRVARWRRWALDAPAAGDGSPSPVGPLEAALIDGGDAADIGRALAAEAVELGERAMLDLHVVAGAVEFVPGHRYLDRDELDPTARRTLDALIPGGWIASFPNRESGLSAAVEETRRDLEARGVISPPWRHWHRARRALVAIKVLLYLALGVFHPGNLPAVAFAIAIAEGICLALRSQARAPGWLTARGAVVYRRMRAVEERLRRSDRIEDPVSTAVALGLERFWCAAAIHSAGDQMVAWALAENHRPIPISRLPGHLDAAKAVLAGSLRSA